MIRPEEFMTDSERVLDLADMAAVERTADAAIRTARCTGVWPAPVGVLRQRIGEAERSYVAARYAAARWVVTERPNSGTYFFIDRPPVATLSWVSIPGTSDFRYGTELVAVAKGSLGWWVFPAHLSEHARLASNTIHQGGLPTDQITAELVNKMYRGEVR